MIRCRVVLMAGVAMLGLAGPVVAQTPSTASDQAVAGADAAAPASAASEIVVTGTRLPSNGYAQPTPVTVAPVADLLKSTPSSIVDGLNNLPQFSNSSSPARSTHNFTNSAENGNLLNLRGVGPNKTLILFDGQRMPPTTYLGSVDVDVIPNLLVQRVDVVTGGASAVYGSDAVAGVVNFVLDKDFTGVKGEAQAGISQRGDNQNYRVGVAAGFKMFGDRGHFLFSAEEYDNKGMLRSDRPISTENYFYGGATVGSSSPPGSAANPYKLYRNGGIGIASATGLMLGGPLAGNQFTAGGTGITPFNPGNATGTAGYYTDGDGFSLPGDDTAIAPLNTKQLFARFSYDLTPDITAHVQGLYSRSALSYSLEANGFVSPSAALFSGNPYLPSVVQDAMTASGTNQINVFLYPFGPNPATTEVTNFYSVEAGLDGHFGDSWKWNVDYNHARSRDRVRQRNTLDWRKTFAATDAVTDPATGNTVCAASLSSDPAIAARYADCSPLNILNPSSTPAGLAYALGTSAYTATIGQDDVAASISGHLFELPAGPVSIAFGGEYRHQSLHLTSNSDPALLDTTAEQDAYFAGLRGVPAGTPAYWLTNVGVAHAKENVKEVFGEIEIPILRDIPFVQSLDLTAAGRYTDYSTSGSVETWKVGGTWSVSRDLTFRVVRSRDIRAPNLYELFSGAQAGIGQLYDPVTNTTDNSTTVTSGNRNLKPERGDTLTFGAVLSPRFLPGFSASIDYYSLKISGAISTLGAQTIVNDCYNSNGTSPECQFITRPSPDAFPTSVQLSPINTARLKTSGIDFDATYRTEVGPGTLAMRLYANYLQHFDTQWDGGIYDLAGYGAPANQPIAYPRWRGQLTVDYRVNAIGLFLTEQYVGSYSLNAPGPNNVYLTPHVSPVWYTNATIDFNVPAHGGFFDFFLTVNNLTDKKPPLIPGAIPGVNLPTIISLYDTVGRAYTAGVRFKF